MKTKEALKMAAVAIDGLESIQGLTHMGGTKAEAALKAIGAIVGSLRDGLDGKTSPEVVQADLDALIRRISDNDAAADAALTAKYRK